MEGAVARVAPRCGWGRADPARWRGLVCSRSGPRVVRRRALLEPTRRRLAEPAPEQGVRASGLALRWDCLSVRGGRQGVLSGTYARRRRKVRAQRDEHDVRTAWLRVRSRGGPRAKNTARATESRVPRPGDLARTAADRVLRATWFARRANQLARRAANAAERATRSAKSADLSFEREKHRSRDAACRRSARGSRPRVTSPLRNVQSRRQRVQSILHDERSARQLSRCNFSAESNRRSFFEPG
jgi:hypothetical protein